MNNRNQAVLAALGALSLIASAIAVGQTPTADAITIVLAGQSMIRSDIRETAPSAVPAIQGLLKGDVVFTNLEAAVAEKGETIHEGRGFLTPPEALDALTRFGFNLVALSGNHAFDLKATGIRNTLREADGRKIVHAGTGNNLAEAATPGYLHTRKGTIALIASASGLIGPEASARPDRPGVNELRVEVGDKENEATTDLPGAPGNSPNVEDSQRILQSIRDARKQADLVIVYQHNHVFGNLSFRSERMAQEVDARGGGRGSGHRGDARRAAVARRGGLQGEADFLRSGQLHLQRAADANVYRRAHELGERRRVRSISREEPAIDLVPASRFE